MSAIGIDFGNESCIVAVARAGGIETIVNDYSLRATPSFVAFNDKCRLLGVAAKNQLVTNVNNTVFGFKRLLGRKYNDPYVKKELERLPFRVIEDAQGKIKIPVNYLGEEQLFSPEQITAMLFTKLKEISEIALKTKVHDCVISVPSFFTDAERRALLDAAQIAGLNVQRLMNETTASALAYGLYKQDLPNPDEKPRIVVLVDMGHSSLQTSAVAFNKGKLKILASVSDSFLGGRDVDRLMAGYFNEEFITKYKVDARKKPRAYIRLEQEVEKLKKQMSANSTILPIAIECFIDEKDVSSRMKRADMESMSSDIFARVEALFRKLLKDSQLRVDDIYSVEVVGGSTRIPLVKQLVQQIFGKEASTTLNQDEAVARGCALQCAMLSPSFKVREFSITDVQLYPIKLLWSADKAENGEMEVFPMYHQIPFTKMLTFYKMEPFTLEARYMGNIPHPDPHIGKFLITKVAPAPNGESAKVKIKVNINKHGIFCVKSATLVEKKELDESQSEEPMDTDSAEKGNGENVNANDNANADQMDEEVMSPGEQNANSENDVKEDSKQNEVTKDSGGDKKVDQPLNKKAKRVVKQVELPIEAKVYRLSSTEMDSYYEKEAKMIAADRQEKERIDAKNALEEYVYEMRGKLSEELVNYISDQDRNVFNQMLEDTENWLYDEGEEQSRQVYVDKFNDLKKHGEPVKDRHREHQERPQILNEFGGALQVARKTLDFCKNRDERYSHITSEEVDKLQNIIEEKQTWLDRHRNSLARLPLHQNPSVLVEQIKKEKQHFESIALPIINKPKPKPKEDPPKETNEAPPQKDSQSKGTNGSQQQSGTDKEKMDTN